MESNPRELVSVLSTYPPGTLLADRIGHYWIRWAKMVITRHQLHQLFQFEMMQKYLLSVPITEDHDVVFLMSWMELCAQR